MNTTAGDLTCKCVLVQYDLVAGISISAMIVPHGLSYASLNGGLPPVFGLYNGFVTLLIYSAFGSCRTLSVGPIAIIYALASSSLHLFHTFSQIALSAAVACLEHIAQMHCWPLGMDLPKAD